MRAAPLLLVPLLAGCSTVSAVTALAVGGGAGAATGNPAVGYAAGLGTQVGLDALGNWYDRAHARGEQDAIAEAAGAAPEGVAEPWAVHHTIPIGNQHGQFMVVREIATPLATCREVVFRVESGKRAHPFTTTICRRAQGWRWAQAEPAVARWGYLQRQ